jgi:hypothetical protein
VGRGRIGRAGLKGYGSQDEGKESSFEDRLIPWIGFAVICPIR